MSIFNKTCRLLVKNSRNLVQIKQIHLVDRSEFAGRYEEIKIPVPWGHLAGRWWGPQDKRPFLCIHGWQESCGSFDPLFKLLPKNLPLLAIDVPGHGHSSRLPNGVYYHAVEAPLLIRRIQKYYKWDKLSLLGHSMGAITSFMYTSLYPDDVDLLICIDAFKPFSQEPGSSIKSSIQYIDKFLFYEAFNEAETKPPSYSIEEMVNMIYLSTRKSVSPESCKYVLERIIEPSADNPEKYYFSRDNRTKVGSLIGIQHTDLLEYAKRVKCPMIVMKATKSSYFEDKKYFYDVVDILKQNNKYFEYLKVEGTHHVHINEPEKIAKIIVEFLDKYYKPEDITQKIVQ